SSRRWSGKRLLALLLMGLVAVTLIFGSAGVAFADEDEDEDDAVAALNFYRLSSSVTALFSEASKPDTDITSDDDEDSLWTDVSSYASSGGSLVGYVDDDYNPIAGWLNSKTAQSSDAIGYNTLVSEETNGVFTGSGGPRDYAFFGATLQSLGLDTTSTGLSLGFFNTMLGGIV